MLTPQSKTGFPEASRVLFPTVCKRIGAKARSKGSVRLTAKSFVVVPFLSVERHEVTTNSASTAAEIISFCTERLYPGKIIPRIESGEKGVVNSHDSISNDS